MISEPLVRAPDPPALLSWTAVTAPTPGRRLIRGRRKDVGQVTLECPLGRVRGSCHRCCAGPPPARTSAPCKVPAAIVKGVAYHAECAVRACASNGLHAGLQRCRLPKESVGQRLFPFRWDVCERLLAEQPDRFLRQLSLACGKTEAMSYRRPLNLRTSLRTNAASSFLGERIPLSSAVGISAVAGAAGADVALVAPADAGVAAGFPRRTNLAARVVAAPAVGRAGASSNRGAADEQD